MDNQLPRLSFDLNESAQMIGLSVVTLRRLIKSNRIRTTQVNRKHLISGNELRRFIGEAGS